MKFVFLINDFKEVSRARYTNTSLEAEGNTVEEAYAKIESQIPEGCRIFMWYELNSIVEQP
jgi:hypothetical protein